VIEKGKRYFLADGLLIIWKIFHWLLFYGTLFFIFFNWQKVLIHVRLAPQTSLFRNFWGLTTVFVVILLLTPFIHEIGHVTAGRIARLKFYFLIIGPVRISRQNGRFQFNWQPGFGLFNGLAASYPEKTDYLRKRMLFFALGGPLASLLLAVTAFLIAWSMREYGRFATTNVWIWETALFTSIVSFLFFLTSIKPGQYQNGHLTDGNRILTLLKGGVTSERWCALVSINAANIQGLRPREWDEATIKCAASISEDSLDSFAANILAYYWAQDSKRIDEAENFLTQALMSKYGWLSGERIQMHLEKAYLQTMLASNLEAAKSMVKQVEGKNTKNFSVYYRVLAKIAFIEHGYDKAAKFARLGLSLLQNQMATGQTIAEREKLNNILRSAETLSQNL
jgi:hypothetical protein